MLSDGKRDFLDAATLKHLANKPHYVPGQPYLWVMGFGWSVIGFYVKHETPIRIKVAHTNFFRNAGVDYGKIAAGEIPDTCEWRYIGVTCINDSAVQRADEFWGKVPRTRMN